MGASGGNQRDRRDYDIAASGSAQDHFNAVAGHLESLIDARDSDVKKAMADYQADGVSDEYLAKEQRWNRVANQVRSIITTLQGSLASNDETAGTSLQKARAAVNAI
jgi:hypothetical protein